MSDRTEYKCDHCNKLYSSYKSRWLHIKKYHNNDVTQNVTNVTSNVTKCNKNVSYTFEKETDKTNKCKHCDEQFNSRQTRWRHEKKCSKILDGNILEKKLEQQQKEIEELKKFKSEIMKSLKIHPKTLQKINSQLNNTNNGTINNITIIPLGKENLSELLTDKEKMSVLSKYGNCLTELVKMVHVSDKDKYKQFKNIYITNLQNNVAYKYDDKTKKFIAVTKNELLESIIDNRIGDIEEFYIDYKDKITPFTEKQITSFLERMNDEKEYKDVKKEEIKFAIYNGREEIIQQIKEHNPQLNLFIN